MKVEINSLSQSLKEIADNVGAEVKNDIIFLPKEVGSGYYKQFIFSSHLKMVIVNCSFNQEFHLVRSAFKQERHTLVLRFHHIFTSGSNKTKPENSLPPSVYITSEGIGTEVIFPAGEKIQNIIISIDAEHLTELIHLDQKFENPILKELLSNKKPFLFEELITPKIHAIVLEIEESEDSDQSLQVFHYRLKALELIYLFLQEFLKRETITFNPINKKDLETIYAIKASILKDLSLIPTIYELSKRFAISESKLKKLFKQVYGQSLHQYFLHFRIQKAASLIRDQGHSISEAGHQTGFTNLSHFSRLFERHLGEKPKKYSMRFQHEKK